jgi:circadian clock protein KaiC
MEHCVLVLLPGVERAHPDVPVNRAAHTMTMDNAAARPELRKARTGIAGLDEITHGGLPAGRPTLVAGGPGSGKTLLGITFLVNGAVRFDEPGVLITFEENAEELAEDVASLGFDLPGLIEQKRLAIDYVHVERSEIEETGEYDLEGLFVRLDHAIASVGAKRVVLDTIESLFGGLPNETVLRAELRRLFRWLRDRDVTVVITGEKGDTSLTRHGLEEYVTDVVIQLDHRVHEQISTRRIRVVKYRGSHHGTNEYPFLIDAEGLSVLPVTSLTLQHEATPERISSGVQQLDDMLGGRGFFRGSTILVSGTAGTGKTTFAAHFANAACARGERCLYFLYEESPSQMIRNMRSVGIDMQRWVDRGLLQFHADRPTRHGLETHLVLMHRAVEQFRPMVTVIDPMTNLLSVGTDIDVRAMLTRMIDFLKSQNVTALFTGLTSGEHGLETSETQVSSLMDSWLRTTAEVLNHRRYRYVTVLKSRGMAHSDEIREFRFSDSGVQVLAETPAEPHGG